MTISVAIVGAGRMGRSHAADLASLDGVRIVGVADVDSRSAADLATFHGAVTHVDYREMLDDLMPDAVYICTPASEHLEQLTFAAERGINVFVEKPLAPSVTAATAAADVVERQGILCTVGYQWRHSDTVDAARDALAGQPITLLAGWWYWTIPLVSWIRNKRWGGGQIFDQGTHLIDVMRYLTGDVSTVYAHYAANAVPQTELPNWDASSVTLGFASGATGSIHSTYALFPDIPASNGLDVVARDLLVRVSLAETTVFRPQVDPVVTAGGDSAINRSFVEAVRRNDPSPIRATAADAAQTVAVTLASNYSAVTGRVLDMQAFFAEPPEDVQIMPTGEPPHAVAEIC